MPYSAYPNALDLSKFLNLSGITVDQSFDLSSYAKEASKSWEEETRYRPFLAGSSQVMFYDPPGPNKKGLIRGGGTDIHLDRGFVSIAEVRTGLSSTDTVGTVRVESVDYDLLPYNASVDSIPYTTIHLKFALWGPTRSVRITGVPGFAVQIPDDAWSAIRKRGAAGVARAIKEGLAGSDIEAKEGDESSGFSETLLVHLGDTWARESRMTQKRYTLMQ